MEEPIAGTTQAEIEKVKPSLAEIGKDTQFKPGQSGNPAGGVKGKRVSTILKEALLTKIRQIDPQTQQPREMELGEVVALALIKTATKGNVRAIKEIMDRTEGKVVQPMELSGAGGIPLSAPIIHVEMVDGEDKPGE